jgi:hypothetical protein
MPVYLDLANIVFEKKRLEQKYLGGCAQFRLDWNMTNSEIHQEDDELMCLSFLNMDEFEIDKLIERGLAFDEELRYSEDFVAISRYEGAYWKTIWLNCNETFAWHSNSDPEQKRFWHY